MDFDEIKHRLSRLDTACVCDGYKALHKPVRAVDPAVRSITPGLRLIGRAHTVTCREDFLTVILALRDALPGEVLVIDSQGSRKALTGELFPTEARRKGLAGIVNDGPCRDTAAIRRLGFPYFARSVNPVAGTTEGADRGTVSYRGEAQGAGRDRQRRTVQGYGRHSSVGISLFRTVGQPGCRNNG
jgi:4-hydroxy-4-methyl-2-oxoglutarate aldolase